MAWRDSSLPPVGVNPLPGSVRESSASVLLPPAS